MCSWKGLDCVPVEETPQPTVAQLASLARNSLEAAMLAAREASKVTLLVPQLALGAGVNTVTGPLPPPPPPPEPPPGPLLAFEPEPPPPEQAASSSDRPMAAAALNLFRFCKSSGSARSGQTR
ncbi:hypothetical protein D3C87_1726540 [compost metagenome]